MENIIVECKQFALDILSNQLDKRLVYHSVNHTLRVVKAVRKIAEAEAVDSQSYLLLETAAWLHDTGYSVRRDGHEEASAEIAAKWLESKLPEIQIKRVQQLILSTKLKAKPKDLLEKIIRDADAAHLGSKRFFEYSDLLREEWEAFGKSFTDEVWCNSNLNFLKQHRFYTVYALENWLPTKEKHISALIGKINEIRQNKEKNARRKRKEESFSRGVETMFRVALRNHISLSGIADQKANILLSVNALILSLVLSNVFSKLDNLNNRYLVIPTFILIIVSLVCIILAIMATRPNVTGGKFTRRDIEEKKVNLLFFGNFHQVPLSEYNWAMNELMKDREYLYNSLIKDLYFLGLVLHKKYRILRTTYTVFSIGLILAVIAYIFTFCLSNKIL